MHKLVSIPTYNRRAPCRRETRFIDVPETCRALSGSLWRSDRKVWISPETEDLVSASQAETRSSVSAFSGHVSNAEARPNQPRQAITFPLLRRADSQSIYATAVYPFPPSCPVCPAWWAAQCVLLGGLLSVSCLVCCPVFRFVERNVIENEAQV